MGLMHRNKQDAILVGTTRHNKRAQGLLLRYPLIGEAVSRKVFLHLNMGETP